MAQRGRPPKINEEICRKIVNAILGGNYLETAAAYAGVEAKTVRRWLIQGRQPKADPAKRDLARRVADALALAEVQAVAEIRAVGMGTVTETRNAEGAVVNRVARRQDWRALAWWLTTARREKWGPPKVDDVYDSVEWEEIKGRLVRCLAKVPGALDALAAEFGEVEQPRRKDDDDPRLLEATPVRVQ